MAHLAMHLPDGFLSIPVSAIFWLTSILFILIALARVNRELGEREAPVMGVLAAAVFAGQMLNFSVAGGTSGHLLGAALATIILGPWPTVVVMTAVVSVQALLFQDGGLVALGANLFNMAVIAPFVAYFVFRICQRLAKEEKWGIFVGGFAAGWTSVVIASLAVALQLSFSGTSPANISIPAMGSIHMLIGIGEGLITVGALSLIYAARPDLLKIGKLQSNSNRWVWVGGLALTLMLSILSPLASTHPDGLEWVAEQKGFLAHAQNSPLKIVPDYLFPGISNKAVATIAAGVLGAFVVLGLTLFLAYSRRRRGETTDRTFQGN
jgi:cobalt/nickel transport system permease protein